MDKVHDLCALSICFKADTMLQFTTIGGSDVRKDELLQALRQQDIKADIENGPTAIVMSNGRKRTRAIVTKSGDNVVVTTGRVFKRKQCISLSGL